MITTGLTQFLNATQAITALVGNNIMPLPAPMDLSSYPCITYQVVSDIPQGFALDGRYINVTDTRINFDCLASSKNSTTAYTTARQIALTLKSALNGLSGALPDGTKVFSSSYQSMNDGYNDSEQLSFCSVQFTFTYQDQ